ncbi:zinc carboxypeptidase-like [Ixodes scapularis]|uniref:zinc carboxypeptidase-like n=1 Tax=Ixodes scapularis TaxID=6945 RepID=UPI001A9EBBB7|nr:zinc carboxypeptidase-like [Ixodes scapularis]
MRHKKGSVYTTAAPGTNPRHKCEGPLHLLPLTEICARAAVQWETGRFAMNWLLILVIGSCGVGSTTAVPVTNVDKKVDYTGHSILSVVPETSDQVDVLFGLQNEMGIDFWTEAGVAGSKAVVKVAPEQLSMFTKKMSEAGMTAKTEVQNVQELIDEERDGARSTTYSSTPLRFRRYLTNAEFESALKSYGVEYDHVQYSPIGKSYEGRDIIGVHITKGTNRPIIFFECGIHAREWVAHATCLYIIDQLATMYKKDETIKRLVDEYEWRIHPVVNPDGYAYTHTIDRLWRKTRSVSKVSGGCRGADANRNFDVGPFCGVGTSNDTCSEIYCGDSPFSEPETRALRDAVLAAQDRVSFYFGLHSYSLLWMFPYSYTTKNATNYQELLTISKRGADAIRKVSGTNYTVGPINKIIYPVTGSSVDWAYEKAGVTKSFALELEPGSSSSDSSQGFLLPPKYILPTAEETWAGIRAAIGSP